MRGPVGSSSLVGRAPFHAPLAVQLVAFVVDQLRMDSSFASTVVGFAERVSFGLAGPESSDPPPPLHAASSNDPANNR
jgi:L-cystine uptake protein TcyP (sodium:dicarboxylate symporter family)